MIRMEIFVYILLLLCVVKSERSVFRAAVYEHAVILPPEREFSVNRSTALGNMMKNIEIFRSQTIIAGNQNVEILVFPEDGIYGMGFSRKALEPYLEYIPDPKDEWNACNFPQQYANTEIQHHLSCMAKDASLYLVANIGDRQPCVPRNDTNCPDDGHYQFNTNVVFNPKGDLIAKYHKINLFFERQFDKPPVSKIVTFETPFGKFAVFTCFDILFKTPAIDALMVKGVGNIVFPTAWMDALPLLAAIEYHSAFAAGAKVNFLAANINLPMLKFHGSGIYSPTGYADFQYSEEHRGKLLIADLPIVNSNYLNTFHDIREFDSNYISYSSTEFYSYVFHDRFTFVPIEDNTGEVQVCNNKLCCFLEYERSGDNSEYFAFGAFDGLHTYQGTYYLQICTLLKCKTSSRNSCGEPVKESSTNFTSIKMRGTFGTPYIFPEVLLANNGLLKLSSGRFWSYNNATLDSPRGFEHPFISVALFARDYVRDSASCIHPFFLGSISVAIFSRFISWF